MQRFLNGEPIEAKRDSPAYVLRKQLAKHKLSLAVAAAFVLVLTGGFVTSLAFWRQSVAKGIVADQRRVEAETERERAEANFQKARDAVDRMLTRVAQDKLAGLPLMEPIRRELLEDALQFYQGFLQEQRESADVQFDTALAYRRVGHLRQELGDNAEAEQAYRESIALLETIAADTNAPDDIRSNLAVTHNTLGILLTQTGRYADAESAFRRAIEIRSRLAHVSPDPAGHLANLSDTHANLGNVLAMIGRMPQAETAYRASLTLMERLFRESPDELYYRQSVPGVRASLAHLFAAAAPACGARPRQEPRRPRRAVAAASCELDRWDRRSRGVWPSATLRADDAHNDLRFATGSLSGWLVGLAMPAIRYIRSRLTEWLPDLRRWGGAREKGQARPKQAGLSIPRLDGTREKVDPASAEAPERGLSSLGSTSRP